MEELYENFQDPDEILSFEVEKMAGIVLSILQGMEEKFCVRNCIMAVPFVGEHRNGGDSYGYPLDRKAEVLLAVSEAFACLRSQVLIVEAPESSDGSMVLSRRARTIKADRDFQQFSMTRRFDRDVLHPDVSGEIWDAVLRGEFPVAIFSAMKAVEIAVREAGGHRESNVGIGLIKTAFGPGGSLRDRNANQSEEDGVYQLFQGAMRAYRNPHSHRWVKVKDIIEAMEVVMLSSHLLRIVDSRRELVHDGMDDG